MIVYTEYQFVVSRPNGPLSVGRGRYSHPLRRGEVVVLSDRDSRAPDGNPFSSVRYLVEQVVHEIDVHKLTAGEDPLHARPLPNTMSRPTVYLRLLDESGQPVPTPSGPIPGVFVGTLEPGDSRDRPDRADPPAADRTPGPADSGGGT